MTSLRRLSYPNTLIIACASFLLISSCAPATPVTSTDPRPNPGYVFVTPNAAPSATPFQPLPATPLPTWTLTPPATVTPLPTFTPTLTATPVASPTASATATSAVPPSPIPTDGSTAPAAGGLSRPQYALTVEMDYAGHTVSVSENVLYPNTSSTALTNLVLGVNPNLWNGVFSLQTLAVNDQAWGNFSLSGQTLTIALPAPLQPGQAIKLGIGYRLFLPASSGKFENFGYGARATNLIDWYPFVVPYINGDWVLPDPYPYGENLVYPEADFLISLTFADPGDGPVVAASAPASLSNGALLYSVSSARNFSFSVSPGFLINTASASGVTIYNYYFPEDASAAAMLLQATKLAVDTYSAKFGPYPHSSLTVVETELNDGLEMDGLYFLSRNFYRSYDGTVHNDLVDIGVHETAHQWWYAAVGNNQATEPWLDEGLATYSEHVFYETNYPGLVNWWWGFRVNYYNPSGWVDSRIYDTSTFRGYVNAVYLNGANFLDSLRQRIGDDAFFGFLQDYYARERGGISSADAFFYILSQHTSANYSDLVKDYFYYR